MSLKNEEMKKKYLPLHMHRLTDRMIQKAKDELNETDEVRGRALEQLKELLEEEIKLVYPIHDGYLMQFLRARKFNVQRAFALLRNKYKVKKAYPEVYCISDLEIRRSIFQEGATCCLPFRDEDGCPIIVFKMGKWDPDKYSMATIISTMTMILLYCVDDIASQVCGVKILLDVKGANWHQLRCVTPYIKLFSKALQNTLPVRFKGIHVYNESMIFQYIWSILKLLMTQKIRNRVHFHGDNQKQLHKFIPKAILPQEYGGEQPNFSFSDWCQREIESFQDSYQVMLACGYEN